MVIVGILLLGSCTNKSTPPNLLFVFPDQMRASTLGFMEKEPVMTPHLDRFASEGLVLTNAVSNAPVCSPYRAMMMSGRYPISNGVVSNTTSKLAPLDIQLRKDEVCWSDILKENGYSLGYIGKWHLGHSEKFLPRKHGFDESLRMDQGSLFLPEDDPNIINAKIDFDPVDKLLWGNLPYAVNFNEGPRMNPDGHLTDYLTNEAVKAIDANKNRSFFMYLAYWAVHSPLQAKKDDYEKLSFIKNHKERVLASMVLTVDRGVGKIRKALKDNGIDQNTIIIFTSDNGAPGYIGLPDLNKPYRGWKLTHFEGGVHIPFIVNYPNKIAAGQIYNGRVSNMDIFSTFSEIAGLKPTNDVEIDGVNILPYLTGEIQGEPDRILFSKSGSLSFLIKEGWKLQIDFIQNKKWLFNLNNDPNEKINLASINLEKLKELEELLNSKIKEQAKPIWPNLLSWPIFIDKTLNQKKSNLDEYTYWPN